MLTKNWYELYRLYFAGKFSYSTGSRIIKSTSGKEEIAKAPASNMFQSYAPSLFPGYTFQNNTYVSSGSGAGIHLGDGAVAPTKDDYYLSGNKITTLTLLSKATQNREDGSRLYMDAVLTFINNTDAPVTVREAAWVVSIAVGNSGSFMFDRTLLDAPVTINPGQTGVVQYTISIDIPE